MSEFEDLEDRIRDEDGDPDFIKIAAKECGCRCGASDCEYSADFFNNGTPSAAFGADIDLQNEQSDEFDTEDYNEVSDDYPVGEEFGEDLDVDGYNEDDDDFTVDEEYAGEPMFANIIDGKTEADLTADDEGVTDNIVYENTADYQMITRDSGTMDTSGS